jgi:hypothetical protein
MEGREARPTIGFMRSTVPGSPLVLLALLALPAPSASCTGDGESGDAPDAGPRADATPDCARLGDGVRLGSTSGAPAAVWTGAEHAVAWPRLQSGISFARLDAAGQRSGTEVELSSDGSGFGAGPSLIWNGAEYGVAWNAAGVYLARLDATGAPLGATTRVSDAGESLTDAVPSLAWNGAEYGVAWQSSDDEAIHFARLDATGTRVGEPVRISSHSATRPVLVAAGDDYGLAWLRVSPPEIYFARISAGGEVLVPDTLVPTGSVPAELSLAWTGQEFGLAWEGTRDLSTAVTFTRLAPDGTAVGSELLVAPDSRETRSPSLIWTGSSYALAWTDLREQLALLRGPDVYFTRLDATGAPIGAEARLTREQGTSPALAESAEGVAVAWRDGDAVFFRIYPCGEE